MKLSTEFHNSVNPETELWDVCYEQSGFWLWLGGLLMGDLLGLWVKYVEPEAWGLGCCPWLGKSPHPPHISLSFSWQWCDESALPFRVHFENVVRSDTLTLWRASRQCGASVASRVCFSSLLMFLQFGNKWDWQREGAHGAVTLY